jgi:uncharacterized protein (TIGR00369 family)
MFDYVAKCNEAFNKMGFMAMMSAKLVKVEKGFCEIHFPHSPAITQQHGYAHAGSFTACVDTACGYAANTMMGEGASVLTVEFKSNFLSPALGEEYHCIGKVVKAGKTLIITTGEVYAVKNGERKLISIMQATMMAIYEDRT